MPAIAPPDPPLTDGSVQLRLVRRTDAADLFRGVRHPSVDPYWSTKFADEQAAVAYVEGMPGQLREGRRVVLSVLTASEPRFIGVAMFFGIDWDLRSAGIGWWLLPEARGRGAATAAVRLICDWAFDGLGLERIQADIDLTNTASQMVADRAGFTREGIRRGLFPGESGRDDLYCYGLLATDRD